MRTIIIHIKQRILCVNILKWLANIFLVKIVVKRWECQNFIIIINENSKLINDA